MNTKRNYISLTFFSLIASFFFCINIHSTTASVIGSSIPRSSLIAPQSDIIQWKYKTINGILYTRQYNYTTNKWIGNWVKA